MQTAPTNTVKFHLSLCRVARRYSPITQHAMRLRAPLIASGFHGITLMNRPPREKQKEAHSMAAVPFRRSPRSSADFVISVTALRFARIVIRDERRDGNIFYGPAQYACLPALLFSGGTAPGKHGRHGCEIIAIPLPCLPPVVRLWVRRVPRYGIQAAPGVPASSVQLSFFFFESFS